MKKFHVIICYIALFGLFSNAGCKKETAPNIAGPLPHLNTAPKAHAGTNILLILPIDFCMLSGTASDAELNIKSYAWKKISGPSAYILEKPDSLVTKLSNLEKGIYEFELTVTDKAGLIGKDITTVNVRDMQDPMAIIFNDLVWSCPWECGVKIKNIYGYFPFGIDFRIYIQRDNSASWQEVFPESQWSANVSYYFSLYNGDLWISYYGPDVADKPDIKLVF